MVRVDFFVCSVNGKFIRCVYFRLVEPHMSARCVEAIRDPPARAN